MGKAALIGKVRAIWGIGKMVSEAVEKYACCTHLQVDFVAQLESELPKSIDSAVIRFVLRVDD